MKTRVKAALLLCLSGLAVWTATEAIGGIKPANRDEVPEEVYASYMAGAPGAEYYLKDSGGYVAVFADERAKTPVTVTDISIEQLRGADRAMLEKGIPVSTRQELLSLLEDLGS